MKAKTIKLPIYNTQVSFVLSNNLEKAAKKRDLHSDGVNYKQYSMVTVKSNHRNGASSWTILIKKYKKGIKISALTHEVNHVCVWVCEHLGINIGVGNDEAYAYMSEFLMGELLNFLNIPERWKL